MSVPCSVAEVLKEHVTLEVEGIDRMYLNVYVPQLQREQGVASFFRFHRGHQFASSVLMDPISKAFVAALEDFAKREQVPVIQFRKGQRKDDIASEYRKKFSKAEGVLFIGKAQEKMPVFRTERRRNETTGATYPWLVRSTAMVNQFYIYCMDRDFGPFFLKFSSYFPYTAKLCINGHEYAKQQLGKKHIKFEALDNGVLSCEDPKRLQAICDGLSAEKIDALLRKWLRLVPHPYTDDDQIHLLTRRPADRHQGWRRFYSIGRWEPRKGFDQLIRAFLGAFQAKDKVSLTIKYSGSGSWPGYPTPEQALAEALLHAPAGNGWTPQKMAERVTLIDGRVTRSQIVGLHLENNIYVSASHGEAWGLPSCDAKLAGNRLVYVGFGGVCDFAADEDILVPHELEPVHESYRWEHGARWAGYQLSDLVEGLQRARLPEHFSRPPGFEEKFSMRAVGEKMRILVDAATPRISTLPPE